MEKKSDNSAVKAFRKPVLRKILGIFVLFLLFVFGIWFAGLFRTPSHFRTVPILDQNEISQYLSNVILPQFYNKSQLPQPFDLVLSQDGVNDIIARQIDTKSLKKQGVSDIGITFKRGKILLCAKTKYHSHNFIVTAIFKPYICEKGFNAGLSKIQVGTSRIPFAASIIRDRLLYQLANLGPESDIVNYVGVLLSDNKITPEFSFNHRKIKIQKILIEEQRMIIGFLPE